MTYESFISRFEKATKTVRGIMVRCPSHEDSTASLSVGRASHGGVLLKCFAGCRPEDVVGALGLSMKDLFPEETAKVFTPPPAVKVNGEKPVIETVYSYTDALGRELYQAVRLKPKSFRQRHRKEGEWVWNMDGVERVLYRLPEVVKSPTVWIVEGEKDADNLTALGFCATCNVGGAGKWLDGYTESLSGKEVVLCGDNDEPGKKHVELVFESICRKVKSVRLIHLPDTFKDVSDFISATTGAKEQLELMAANATPHIGGIRLPIYSMADLEASYQRQTKQSDATLDLSRWLPSLRKIRPLIPGEMCLIVADTGTGKTAILQNIALMASQRMPVLLFEIELPGELLFERFFALKAGLSCRDIEIEYQNNSGFGAKSIDEQFPNLFICPESRLTVEQLETLILKSELRMGDKPAVVLVDYVQLIQGPGSRYERMSAIAESLKVMAKTTRTILIVSSQVARPQGDSPEIGLHSGRDSSSLENSAGLVIGVWRDAEDRQLMNLRILKSTKGGAGLLVECNFNGEKMQITERARL